MFFEILVLELGPHILCLRLVGSCHPFQTSDSLNAFPRKPGAPKIDLVGIEDRGGLMQGWESELVGVGGFP